MSEHKRKRSGTQTLKGSNDSKLKKLIFAGEATSGVKTVTPVYISERSCSIEGVRAGINAKIYVPVYRLDLGIAQSSDAMSRSGQRAANEERLCPLYGNVIDSYKELLLRVEGQRRLWQEEEGDGSYAEGGRGTISHVSYSKLRSG